VILVPVQYFILCYVGISGFVVVFTVLPIAKTIYEETDTPWRLYCCAGAQTVSAAYLAGSIQAGNVYATDICGTTTMAGWKLSVISVVVFWAVSLMFLWIMLKVTQKKGEAFLPSGEGIRMANLDEGLSEDCLPGLLPSILPLAVVLVMSAVFQIYVVKALFAGCILTIITGHRNLLPKLKISLSQGITAVYGPILSVSATYAIGAVVKNIEGFTYFQNMLSALPHLMSGSLMGLLAAFIMASVAAPIPAFGSHMLEQYTLAGLSAGNAHRMMMLTSFTSIAPHNAGIPNAAAVLRMPYAECLKMYMLSTYIPGFITLFAAILCIKMGIV
jgi:H+/gluconate symporter-like permease